MDESDAHEVLRGVCARTGLMLEEVSRVFAEDPPVFIVDVLASSTNFWREQEPVFKRLCRAAFADAGGVLFHVYVHAPDTKYNGTGPNPPYTVVADHAFEVCAKPLVVTPQQKRKLRQQMADAERALNGVLEQCGRRCPEDVMCICYPEQMHIKGAVRVVCARGERDGEAEAVEG